MRTAIIMAMALLLGGASSQDARMAKAAKAAMARTGAKGLAIATIDHGRVISVQSFGVRNAAGDPLTTDTIMYGASITKAVFGYYVMMLVDDGKLSLDRPIAALLPRPLTDYGNLDAYENWGDLAGDDRWRSITPRMALTHSTGFANFSFVEPDQKLHIHFAPGSRYAYSGAGLLLLQFALAEGLHIDVGADMQRRIFTPLGMTRTSLMWRPDFAGNLADGWTIEGKPIPHDERSRVRASGSMDTTIADLARFAAAASRGWGLSKASGAAWTHGWLPITTRQQFPTLLPEAPATERFPGLSAGLGIVTFIGPQGPGFFKGGHDDQTANTMVCVKRRQRCVLILSNDVRAEAAFPDLVAAALGDTGVPYRWEYPDLYQASTSDN